MAADPSTGNHPADPTDLPLQPTGSGVADTEIARMAARLADHDLDGDAATADERDIDKAPLLAQD